MASNSLSFIKFLKKIKDLRGNKISTIIKFILTKSSSGRILFFKGTSIDLKKNSFVDVRNKGALYINRKWNKNDPFPTLFSLAKNAKLIVNGTFSIYSGSRIYVNENAKLELGSGFINNNLNISCFQQIEIGQHVVISENVTIRDSDNHEIVNSTNKKTLPIRIGNHVWIGMNVTILKGVTIGDGAVIAAGSIVTKDIPGKCLAAGIPARVVKSEIEWK